MNVTPQDILNDIRTYFSENYTNLDTEKIITFRESQSKTAKKGFGGSIYFFSALAIQLDFKKGICRMVIKSKYYNVTRDIAPDEINEKNGNVVFYIKDLNQLLSLHDIFVDIFEDSTQKDFSCCSRYMECSDAIKCVQPLSEIYLHCSYRQKIRCGKVFLGKNRNI